MAIDLTGGIATAVKSIVDKGASLIGKFVADKDLAAKLSAEFKAQMSEENHEYRTLLANVERDIFTASQKTIQAELAQSDLYTKRTRPKIARQSWYLTVAYVAATLVTGAAPKSWGLTPIVFQWFVFMAMASPALSYMGIRGFEKWRNGAAL